MYQDPMKLEEVKALKESLKAGMLPAEHEAALKALDLAEDIVPLTTDIVVQVSETLGIEVPEADRLVLECRKLVAQRIQSRGSQEPWDDPDWEKGGRIHNWRTHVSREVRAIWGSFTSAQRRVLYQHFESLAENECYDYL